MSALAAIRAEFKIGQGGPKKRTKVKRSVSFGEKSIRNVSTVDATVKNEIWYTPQELKCLNMNEIEKTQQCQNESESNEVTWRGLERMQESQRHRSDNIRYYVRTVVMEHQEHAGASELKRIAKSLSRPERVKAHTIALKDEEAVLGGPSKVPQSRVRILNRTLSGSVSWMKRSQPSFMKKETSAVAA